MSTSLIALGVIVALLAIVLTPGMSDFSMAVFPSIGDLPNSSAFAEPSDIAKTASKSAETLTGFLKTVSIVK